MFTELSDFYKLNFTILKAHFQEQKPNVIKYRSYKENLTTICLKMTY